jgi:hypothetical protein
MHQTFRWIKSLKISFVLCSKFQMFASNEDLSLNLIFRHVYEQFNNCVHVRIFISKNANCVSQMLAFEVDGYFRFRTNHALSKFGPKIHHLGH